MYESVGLSAVEIADICKSNEDLGGHLHLQA